jgi:hypothetical protein
MAAEDVDAVASLIEKLWLPFDQLGRVTTVQQWFQSTVRTQVKAIYRKLGVSSRNDALQKATAVGLLGG